MASLDTSCLLRWLIGDIPEQARAVERLMGAQGHLTISDAAMLESCFVLEKVYGRTRRQIVVAMSRVLGEGAFDMDGSLWFEMFGDYLSRPKLSIMDIYLVHRAQLDSKGPLYTFDQKLASQMENAALLTADGE